MFCLSFSAASGCRLLAWWKKDCPLQVYGLWTNPSSIFMNPETGGPRILKSIATRLLLHESYSVSWNHTITSDGLTHLLEDSFSRVAFLNWYAASFHQLCFENLNGMTYITLNMRIKKHIIISVTLLFTNEYLFMLVISSHCNFYSNFMFSYDKYNDLKIGVLLLHILVLLSNLVCHKKNPSVPRALAVENYRCWDYRVLGLSRVLKHTKLSEHVTFT